MRIPTLIDHTYPPDSLPPTRRKNGSAREREKKVALDDDLAAPRLSKARGHEAVARGAFEASVSIFANSRTGRSRRKVEASPHSCGCCNQLSGAKFVERDAFHCASCTLTGDDVLCEFCALACHAGHDLRFAGRLKMYCDCAILAPGHHLES